MILNRLTLGLLSIFFSFTLLAQNKSFNLVKEEGHKSNVLSSQFRDYNQYTFEISTFKEYLDNQESIEPIILSIPEIGEVPMELYPYDLISDKHFITTATSDGNKISQLDQNITYKGYTPNGVVRLTISDGYINGFFETKQGTFYMESASSLLIEEDYVVIYNQNDVRNHDHGGCAFSDKEIAVGKIEPRTQKVAADCYEVDLGVATDYSMYQKHGDTESLINHLVAVMNNVAANYEYNSGVNFDDGIEFKLVEHFISACANCDPWTNSSDVFTVYYDFKDWTDLENGFQNDVHLGQFWTDRNFDGAYVGLAGFGEDLFCNGKVNHVLQDFTSNAAFLRVMTSHEIGHNFNGLHVNTSGYIMSSSVNNTNNWNSVNQIRISTEILDQGPSCLATCSSASTCASVDDVEITNINASSFDVSWTAESPNDYTISIYDEDTEELIQTMTTTSSSHTLSPPGYGICENYRLEVYRNCSSGTSVSTILLFESPKAQGCADFCPNTNIQWFNSMVDFSDESENATSWLWDFGDGTTSALQNPSHMYSNAGFYDVTLEINNGSHTMTYDSIVAILPDRNLPYSLGQGGSFDTAIDDFASMSDNNSEDIWEKGIATGPLSSTTNVWKTNLDGDVGSGDLASILYTPRFDFSSTGIYILKFDLSMEIQYCNAPIALQLQYSTDMGASWTRLGSHGDDGGFTQNWYNRGPSSACPLATQVFADETGWTFNGNDIAVAYDVSFLSGNYEVVFRFYFAAADGYSAGYDVDGVMIDDFEIEIEGVVPVTLTEFSGVAKEDFNELSWHVEQAINFDHFSIEKSEDGQRFDEFERMSGRDSAGKYATIDYNPLPLTYYRIKMVDLDGSFKYSKVISITNEKKNQDPKVYPNPVVAGEIFIGNSEGVDELEILDISGKVIFRTSKLNDAIDVSPFESGVYLLRFIANGKITHSSKLVRI